VSGSRPCPSVEPSSYSRRRALEFRRRFEPGNDLARGGTIAGEDCFAPHVRTRTSGHFCCGSLGALFRKAGVDGILRGGKGNGKQQHSLELSR